MPNLALTDRELDVLRGMSLGESNSQIARELHVSVDTVKEHAKRLFRRLGARDRAHAVRRGFEEGLLQDSVGQPPDGLADALVELADLALAFGRIDRTAVYHPDGITPESDSDHTVMLGWLACALAARCHPDLDVGLVAQFALVHDAPEVYAGDTPTLRIDAAGRAAKVRREAKAVQRLTDEFLTRLPWFPQTIARYERQLEPEARFVRAVDKLLPKIVHLLDGCTGLRHMRMGRAELAHICERQRQDMTGYAGEFTTLMELRTQLVDRLLAELDDIAGEQAPARVEVAS